MNRKLILFKINNVPVVEEPRDLNIVDIERIKWEIANECECEYDEVEVETIDLPNELSQIDVTSEGLFDWADTDYKIFSGTQLTLVEGSDEYLDALSNGTLHEFIKFI